jgi:hypothetical protein
LCSFASFVVKLCLSDYGDVGDPAIQTSRAAQNRRASTCHRERAA